MRIFTYLFLAFCSFSSSTSEIDKKLIYGQWRQVNSSNELCPFSIYEYRNDSTMLSANVFCGVAGAVAVNYRTKWEFIGTKKIKDKLIYVDDVAKNWITPEQMQNEYLIKELTAEKLVLVNTKSNEEFVYQRLK